MSNDSGEAAKRNAEALVEASSLGTPEAKVARESVSDETAARVVARARELETAPTITDFLLARIAQDEAAARDFEFGRMAEDGWLPKQVSPARVLADCEAKRQIVEQVERNVRDVDSGWLDHLLAHLATAYADHPDYNPDWRP